MDTNNTKKYRFNTFFQFLLTIVLFISGALAAYYLYFTYFYYDYFNFSTNGYTDTAAFEEKYLQYNERTALYLRHTEQGYNMSGRKPKYIDFASSLSQTNFDYYYNKLFNENNTFFFYISDELTGKYYYNTSMSEQLQQYLAQYNIPVEYDEVNTTRISKKTLDAFTKVLPDIYSVIEINTITSTDYTSIVQDTTDKYSAASDSDAGTDTVSDASLSESSSSNSTIQIEVSPANNVYVTESNSVAGNTYSYTNVISNSPFISHTYNANNYYITSYFSKNEPGYACSYTIYTGYIESDFVIGEFGEIKSVYDTLAPVYKNSLMLLPVAIAVFIVAGVLIAILCGHKYNSDTISLSAYDKIPIEILTLSLLIPIGIIAFNAFSFSSSDALTLFSKNALLRLLFIPYTIGFIFVYPYFLSIIKNLKAHTFIEHTITLRFFRFVFKNIFLNIFEHAENFFKYVKQALSYKDLRRIVFIKMIMICVLDMFIYYICLDATNYNDSVIVIVGLLLILSLLIFFSDIIYHMRDMTELRILTERLAAGELELYVPTDDITSSFRSIYSNIGSLSNVLSDAVDKQSRSERMKAELITNVSHDIKTPLTSIINYVDLLKRKDIDDETRTEYLRIIQEKSWRLKSLIDDLMEVSKASSKTLKLMPQQLNLTELIKQSIGEFEDKFVENNLEIVANLGEAPLYIFADGRSTFRIIENLLSNACKYSIRGSRVYIDTAAIKTQAVITVKNVSQKRLSINPDELMERFVRGDSSRNTEGNGLGLSIAKSLTEVQDGQFEISFDGDLFKVSFTLPLITTPVRPYEKQSEIEGINESLLSEASKNTALLSSAITENVSSEAGAENDITDCNNRISSHASLNIADSLKAGEDTLNNTDNISGN